MLTYHIPDSQRIFELPIYRCTEEQHRAAEDERFESWIKSFEAGFLLGGRTPERMKIWEDYRGRAYGDATTLWDFNQIVGWIRLYAWPGNIRAYLFFVRERVTKALRRKTFDTKRGNFVEMHVFPELSNEEILSKLKKAILVAARENRRLSGLYVDTGILDVLGPHIDWIRLTKTEKPTFDREGFWSRLADFQKSSSIQG